MKKVFVKFLLCFGMVLCFFTSCEIGLGAQVDVEPPSVVMESPTENARTRKTVTFSGTWTDDLEIKQVTVELKKTTELTDVKESFSFIANTTNNGDDKTKGTWSYCLDTEAANIPDGAYTVIATAEDTYGHTNQVSTVITIDNTPPLIVLESPSTTEISSPMSYGKTFSIIGRGADEQNGGTVDSIDAVIYDENNVEIARKTFTNISTSIDFKIADWDEKSEQGNNFYKTIYGTDENAGTKNYYVELIAYDDARKVPAEEGDRGNSTNIIYLNNTLSLIDGYKPSVAYNILNRSASSDSESALEKALKDKANQINKLTFSLNPVNNPYFEVQGYESLGTMANLEDERYSFLNKNKLTVNVYVGRDNKQIRPETVGIYLEPCDVNGNVTGSSKVTLLEPGAISSSGAITDKAVYTEEFKYSSASCTWTSKSLDVETIDGLEIGKYYKVNVSAQDYNNVNIRNSNNYALKITTVNSAPIIIINEPGASLTIAKSAAYTVKGVVKTSSKITKIRLYKNEFVEANYQNKEYVVNASETINDSGVAALKDKIVLNTSQTTVSQRYYNFSFEVEGINDSDYTLVVVAFDDNNQYAQKEISIENDVNEPTFDDSPTITPLVSSSINEDTGGGKYTVNGTINIAELISDDKKVVGSWWSDSDTMPDATKDEGWNAGNLDGSSATNLKFSIDTTKFTDKSKKIIHLKAKDASGNIATDSSVIKLYVDQSTDAPVVELSNTNANTNQAAKDYPELDYNNEWNEEAYLAAKQSPNRTVFGTKSNNEMLGTISDDDGIKSVEVYYQKIELETTENGENKLSLKGEEQITLDTSPNGKTTYSLKAKMPSDQGTYLITINVKDSKQDTTGYNSTTIGPFLVAVDDGAPKLKIETASGGFKPSKFSVSGTIDDPYATLKRYTDEACSQNEKTITINSNCTWVDEIEVDTENNIYTYYYKAEDDYNQSSIESFSFKYDKKAPVFMVESVNGDKIESTNSQTQTELLKYGTIDGTYFMITGLVSDFFYTTVSEPSKENVLYEYDNKDNNETDKENNYNNYLNQNENTASGFSESDFYYYVGKTELVKTEADTSYDITKDGWSTCKVSPLDPAGYIGKWTVSINFKELGCENSDIRYIYFAAKDSAGNVSIIDNKIPVIKIVIDSESPKITGSTITVQEKPVIKVSATDNIKINTEKLSVYNNNALMTASKDEQTGEYEYTTTSSTDDESKKTTVTFKITLTSVPVGKNKYKVEVVDEAGNKATVDDITIENKAPVISGTTTGIPDNAYKVEQDGNQYSYITKVIASSATVKCTEDNNKLKDVTWKDTYIKTEKYEDGAQTNTIELNSGTCSPDSAGIITIAEISEESFKKYENAYVTRTVTATNIYGQTSEWNFYYILDSIKPKLLANLEGNVDITTLGGTNVNSLGTVWFNKDTLEIKGSYFEEGSGIKQIEYELTDGIDNSTVQTGMIYTSSPVDKKESFSSIISGFTESSTKKAFNVIKLTATDKAGNVSASQSYNIRIDTTVPKLIETTVPQNQNEENSESTETSTLWYRFVEKNSKWKKYDNSILTNRTKSIELAGGFEDKNGNNRQSGVSEISVKTGEKQIFAKVYAKSEDGNWKISDGSCPKGGVWIAKIDAEDLTDGNGVKSVVISIKDYAGNVGNMVSASILVDTVAPNGVIEMPGDGNVLNGKVTFSGKVNDANDVKSILIYYAKGEYCPTNFAGFENTSIYSIDTDSDKNISMSDITSWRINDVEVKDLLSEGESKSTVYLLPVAYDKAGNCSISGSEKLTAETTIEEKYCTKVTIDLDSDRPIVKFNNLSGSGDDCYVTSNNLNISVEDDDGINEVKFILSGSEEKSVDWANAESVILNSGSGTIPLGGDGIKSLYLKITDTAQGEFITAFSDEHKRPYIKYSNADKTSNDEPVKFHKDTAVPLIDNITYASGKDGGALNEKGALDSSSIAGGVVGQCLVFKVDAKDSGNDGSGIKSVQLKVNSESDDNIELKFNEESELYETDVINLSEQNVLHAGNNTLVFIVQDKAGFSSTATKQIIIDNSGPSATLITPSSEDKEAQTGIITLSGTANDEYSTVKDVRYLVLNNNYYDGEDGKGTLKSNVSDLVRTEITKEGYKCFNSGSNNTWKFTLDGLVQVDEKKNPLLPYDETTLKDYSKVPRDEKDILTMRVYIYAKDDLGNESVNGFDFKYNPFGDRPQAEINYPTGTQTEKANVNGAIRVTGAASDNVSVKDVYIQLDVNKDGDFTDADKTILSGCKDVDTPIYEIVESIENSDMSAIDNNFWGIKVNGTNSWNYTINKFSELLMEDGNKVAEGKYSVNIRAVALDNNNKFGNWSEIQYVEFDTNIPTIGKRNKNVIEYAEDKDTVKATKAYITDMYLKGKVDLELSVEDKEGIKQVMYYEADTEEGLASAKGTIINDLGEEQTWGSGATETKGYIVKIPLAEDSTASGTKYVKVVATKNSDTETTAYEKFCVNFDNSAPVLNGISLNGVTYDVSDKKIVNSNGTYFTFGSTVNDEGGSGFDKLVFYYYREKSDGTKGRIYNPMIDSVSEGKENAGRIDVSSMQKMEIAGKPIYGSEQTVIIADDKKTVTLSTTSTSIRAGGLVNINGNWITIDKVDGTTVTLKSDSSVTGEGKTAFFAYAQVIDNTGSEKTDASGNVTSASDDGDGMAESIIKNLNVWTVDASFHSNYIPDGPGKLVVFAFDKAGNVRAGSYEASVQNNAPRLTRVMLATDLNGDGKYQYDNSNGDPVNNLSENATANGTEFGEFAFYSTLNNMGEASNIATVSLPAGRDAFIVKNKLLVVPEFVGGNGELKYTYKIADTLEDATMSKDSDENIDLKPFDSNVEIDNVKGNFDDSKTTIKDVEGNPLTTTSKKFVLSNDVFEGKESWTKDATGREVKETKYLAATFWDSTPETTQGEDSCYALLKMPIIVNIVDDTDPTANIIPFYWNSKEDSSFVYDENGNPLGHIDIPAVEGNPGVSGQVYIEGEAWDDTRLGAIVMITPKDSTGTGTEEHTVATYNKSGAWQKTTGWPENWLDFEILEDLGITQAGHTVKWRMKINMTPYGIGTGKTIQVKAKDAAKTPNESTVSDTQTKTDAQTPTYKMDCVPYIKSIYTTTIGSANRSRLGKFPVRAGETMTIEGMNFARGASYKVNFYKTGDDGKPGKTADTAPAGTTNWSGTIPEDGKITVDAPSYSRWVEVVVSDAPTQNNTNTNDGYNIEAGYKATDSDKGAAAANTAGTNFWTDDRYVSVWNVGTALPGSINPHSGVTKKIRAEDTYNGGKIGIRGSSSNIEPVNNMTDNYVTYISSDDMRTYVYDNTNKNYALGSNTTDIFTSPVDAVDMVVLGGLPYYVLQTNFVGNSDANIWGPGLIISREGFTYSKNFYENGNNSPSESTYQWIIEKQGNNTSAAQRDSKGGYDSILYQFKNPRITGWHTDNPSDDKTQYSNSGGAQYRSQLDYVYVSYYDSYAKCLKFAAFRSGREIDSNGKISNIEKQEWGGGNTGDKELVAEIRSANGNMTTGATVVAGYDTTENNPTSFTEKAGEWSDIVVDVTSGSPIPIIVYYNETKKCLEVAQGNSKFPKSANYGAIEVTKRTGADAWNKTEIKLSGKDFGRYVSCAIDKSGNLHVAAQDATNSTLYYLYLTKNGTSYELTKSILLDATSGSGVWTDIELTNPSAQTLSEILPVISYINSGYVGTTNGMKAAYISSGTGNNVEFDVMTDPAKWSVGNQRTSVMPDVYDSSSVKSPVAVGFNSDMFAVDFLRGED